MVASMLVILVFTGVSQYYVGGRRQLDYEEDRRAATELLADRFDGIRREYLYDELPALSGTDTTYVLYNRSYLISHVVVPGYPETHATTLRLTASWTAKVAGADVARSMDAATILARGMP
jgi:hypothetical protein